MVIFEWFEIARASVCLERGPLSPRDSSCATRLVICTRAGGTRAWLPALLPIGAIDFLDVEGCAADTRRYSSQRDEFHQVQRNAL
jgi:hypothetical protein